MIIETRAKKNSKNLNYNQFTHLSKIGIPYTFSMRAQCYEYASL